MTKAIHWKLCESQNSQILWDFSIQIDKKLENNRPHITVVERKTSKCQMIEASCPFGVKIEKKEYENGNKYRQSHVAKNLRRVEVIPVVNGALGTVSGNLGKSIEKMELDLTIKMLQKSYLLGMARIIRKVLDCI